MTRKPGDRSILLYLLKRPSFNSAQLYRLEFFVKLPLMPGARKRDYDATIENVESIVSQ
jgi:hypothetical protein